MRQTFCGLVAAASAVAGCRAIPPPPVLPPHAVAAPDERGSTTALIVVGGAAEILGGGGIGVALRVEHQYTDDTALGLELTGGRGDRATFADGTGFHHALLAVRGYGRYAPVRAFAVTYSLGLSATRSGLIALSASGGGEVSDANSDAEPLLAAAVAIAQPLRRGQAFAAFDPPVDAAGRRSFTPDRVSERPEREVFLAFDLGLVVPIDDGGNRVSIDLGLADAIAANTLLLEGSLADAIHRP